MRLRSRARKKNLSYSQERQLAETETLDEEFDGAPELVKIEQEKLVAGSAMKPGIDDSYYNGNLKSADKFGNQYPDTHIMSADSKMCYHDREYFSLQKSAKKNAADCE